MHVCVVSLLGMVFRSCLEELCLEVLEDEQFAHGNLADFRDEQTANASLIALKRPYMLLIGVVRRFL